MYNNEKVSEELLNRDNILKYISEYDVYNYYIPGIRLGKAYLSPLRKENNPSFGIFYTSNGKLLWKDHKIGSGDCFKLVALIENLSYYGAMDFINRLFDLNLLSLKDTHDIISIKRKALKTKRILHKKKKPIISIKSREWLPHDEKYFSPLNIRKLKIIPIKFFWLDDQLFNTDKHAYAYRYDKNIYKIYQPFRDIKKGKWWSNISYDTPWFGHDGLDYNKDILIVASSNKDASIFHQIGLNSIAPHSESQIFSAKQYEFYKKKFKKIIIFYDNDDMGIEYATKFSNTYNLEFMYLEELDTKDPFEFIKKYDMQTFKEWLEQWI